MGKWFPFIYDSAMKPLEKRKFSKIREELLQKARGRVLEIGSGTGINFHYYHHVDDVDAIEPNPLMIEQSVERSKHAAVPIHLHVQSAEQLDFQNDTFDTVVATLVLCSIPDPMKALNEMKRVCKPHATVLLFEHVKMKQPFLAKMQDVLTPVWKKVCDGCHLNRNTLELVKEAGFQVNSVKFYYKGLFIVIECES